MAKATETKNIFAALEAHGEAWGEAVAKGEKPERAALCLLVQNAIDGEHDIDQAADKLAAAFNKGFEAQMDSLTKGERRTFANSKIEAPISRAKRVYARRAALTKGQLAKIKAGTASIPSLAESIRKADAANADAAKGEGKAKGKGKGKGEGRGEGKPATALDIIKAANAEIAKMIKAPTKMTASEAKAIASLHDTIRLLDKASQEAMQKEAA